MWTVISGWKHEELDIGFCEIWLPGADGMVLLGRTQVGLLWFLRARQSRSYLHEHLLQQLLRVLPLIYAYTARTMSSCLANISRLKESLKDEFVCLKKQMVSFVCVKNHCGSLSEKIGRGKLKILKKLTKSVKLLTSGSCEWWKCGGVCSLTLSLVSATSTPVTSHGGGT